MTAALVVVDMQNDFCLPSSRLFVAGAATAIAGTKRAVAGFRAAGAPVIWVMRHHRPGGEDVDRARQELFRETPFLIGSPGADLVDGLAVAEGEVIVVKRRWSAFFATDLDLVLRRLGAGTVVVAGVQTPNCIRATAVDATSLDYETVVLSDATASASDAVQAANLFDMANMGIRIATVDEALREIVRA